MQIKQNQTDGVAVFSGQPFPTGGHFEGSTVFAGSSYVPVTLFDGLFYCCPCAVFVGPVCVPVPRSVGQSKDWTSCLPSGTVPRCVQETV